MTTSDANAMFVVFDLDGTLSDASHRVHHLNRGGGKTPDWRAFYAACADDPPIREIISVMQAVRDAGHRVEIWSGRSDEVADDTLHWLATHVGGNPVIRMRRAGDFTPDTALKRQWLEESDRRPDLVFEDRASVVSMWRDNGIACAQVAPGEF